MSNKQKHLELISRVVERLAGNSFLIKGWAVLLVSAVLGFSARGWLDPAILPVPIIALWLLDAYYLYLERRYRSLFDDVRSKEEDEIDFCMKLASSSKANRSYIAATFSLPVFLTYGGLSALAASSWLLQIGKA